MHIGDVLICTPSPLSEGNMKETANNLFPTIQSWGKYLINEMNAPRLQPFIANHIGIIFLQFL